MNIGKCLICGNEEEVKNVANIAVCFQKAGIPDFSKTNICEKCYNVLIENGKISSKNGNYGFSLI